jgi:hypothetical protein
MPYLTQRPERDSPFPKAAADAPRLASDLAQLDFQVRQAEMQQEPVAFCTARPASVRRVPQRSYLRRWAATNFIPGRVLSALQTVSPKSTIDTPDPLVSLQFSIDLLQGLYPWTKSLPSLHT